MAIVLYRVDERLIHGQVAIGWGHELRPTGYVLVDDELADSAWEQDLYRLGAADHEVVFVDVASARAGLPAWRASDARLILLTRDVGTMARLAGDGLMSGESVNLGGIHHGPGRDEVLRYIHLTDQDRHDLARMAEEGVQITARDLPDAPRVALSSLLKG